ncbi:MAG: hypothetical protein ATN35_08660 [Epulopiscium sp. Nele67-Bin004]|nr:MAG: hypothetical protein ATN35_08660 [Epulopiscium sp. Nele67-Bin004]
MSEEKNSKSSSARDLAKSQNTAPAKKLNIPYNKIYAVLLSVLIVGILFTTLADNQTKNEVSEIIETFSLQNVAVEASSDSIVSDDYERDIEKRLKDILGDIEGVGDVNVMVTLQSSSQKVLAQDTNAVTKSTTETDSTGGSRTILEEDIESNIIITSGSEPYILIREDMPTIEGVLVVAEGGGDASIRVSIIESVSSLLNIPISKVSVFKMETK